MELTDVWILQLPTSIGWLSKASAAPRLTSPIHRAFRVADWELSSIVAPPAAILFANDTAYTADPQESVFKFGPPQRSKSSFRLPTWLRSATHVLRIDADGAHDIEWSIHDDQVTIKDTPTLDAIYIAANDSSVGESILHRRQAAMNREDANTIDMEAMLAIQE